MRGWGLGPTSVAPSARGSLPAGLLTFPRHNGDLGLCVGGNLEDQLGHDGNHRVAKSASRCLVPPTRLLQGLIFRLCAFTRGVIKKAHRPKDKN